MKILVDTNTNVLLAICDTAEIVNEGAHIKAGMNNDEYFFANIDTGIVDIKAVAKNVKPQTHRYVNGAFELVPVEPIVETIAEAALEPEIAPVV